MTEVSRVLAAAERALAPAGAPAAALAARALVGADLAGRGEFGLVLLTALVGEGCPRLAPAPAHDETSGETADETQRGSPNRVRLDGLGLFGPTVVAQATVLALDLVGRTGSAVVTVEGLGRLGRLAPYVSWLARRGVVAVLAADAPPAVAPAGGTRAVIGTNPLAAALPVRGRPPLVVDTATSALTQAALRAAADEGRPLPDGAALDAAGRPTTDPTAARAIAPRGDAFGSSVGLLVAMLAAGATGRTSATGGQRSAVLLAFRAADGADRAGADLVRSWRSAGGHVPGADDLDPDDVPDRRLDVTGPVRAALDRLAPGW